MLHTYRMIEQEIEILEGIKKQLMEVLGYSENDEIVTSVDNRITRLYKEIDDIYKQLPSYEKSYIKEKFSDYL